MRTQALWKVLTHMLRARRADQIGDPLTHLTGGLVGERDRQHLARSHPSGGKQVRDAPGQHPGLAGTGSGDDEQRPALVNHGRALLRIQIVDSSASMRAARAASR